MKTEKELRAYLEEAGGDLKEARRIACERHCFMDQTIDMKFVQLDRIARGEHED